MFNSRSMTAFILTLGFGAAIVTACDTQSERHNGGGVTAPSPAATMFPTPSPTVSSAAALTPFDKEFVMDAARDGMMEVQMGNAAARNAASNEVKRFGQRVATDHSQLSQSLRSLASNLNIELPQELEPEQRNLVGRLQNLSGKVFDSEYIKVMIDGHMKDIPEFERAANQATNPEIKQFASQALPILRDHLKMARDIAGKLGVKFPQGQ